MSQGKWCNSLSIPVKAKEVKQMLNIMLTGLWTRPGENRIYFKAIDESIIAYTYPITSVSVAGITHLSIE